MKKFAFFLLLAVLTAFSATAQAQSLDDILKAHFEAIGQEQMLKLQSVQFSGKVIVQGGMLEIPMTMTQKRPGKMITESSFQGQKFIEAFDGSKGWRINPFMGSPDPQAMTADEIRSTKMQADMDGTLYNYAEKGFKAELMGAEEMEGSKVWKVRLTNQEGEHFTYFIDADSYVLLKAVSKVKIQGNDMESETYMGNYKKIENMLFPFNMETKMQGQVVSTVVIEDVKLNLDVDDARFNMPGGAPAAEAGKKPAEKEKTKPEKTKKGKKEKK